MEANPGLTTIEAAPALATPASRSATGRRRVSVRRVLAPAALACAVAGLAYLGTWPPLAIVQSGSMAPTIGTGDVVVLARLNRAARVGDVVAVSVPDEARSRYGYPPEVIHRVVRIAPNGDLTTKGDARKAPDPFTVRGGTVRQRVLVTIPGAGRALGFFTSTLGLIWLALGGLLLVGLPLLERRRETEQRERESTATLHSQLRSIGDELERLRDEGDLRERHIAALVREAAAGRAQLADAIEALSRRAPGGAPAVDADRFADLERPVWEGEPPPPPQLGDGERDRRAVPPARAVRTSGPGPPPRMTAPRARRRPGGLLRRVGHRLYR